MSIWCARSRPAASIKIYPCLVHCSARCARTTGLLPTLHRQDHRLLAGNVAQLEARRPGGRIPFEDGFRGSEEILATPPQGVVLMRPSYEIRATMAVVDMVDDAY